MKTSSMSRTVLLSAVLSALLAFHTWATNAPISTLGTVTTSGNAAVVPMTCTNFINISNCGLEIHYDPSIAAAASVSLGPSVAGGINANLTVPGVIIIGWYTWPGITMPDNSVIFNIGFTRVASGTTALTFYDNGTSCYWADGNFDVLNDLPTATYYIDGSLTFASSINADFSANNTTPALNATVQFTDLSTGSPTSWTWSFNRTSVTYVGGTSNLSQNPQVQFTEGGLYTVTLVASTTGNSDMETKVDYIRAGTPGVWTGATSGDWQNPLNWQDWLVPGAATDVVVPSSATNWPVLAGDLTLGTTCSTMTLNGAAQATVSGNLFISAGTSLTFAANGTLHVTGNWTNAGTFTAGSGTVDFTGTGASALISAGSPAVINNFWNLKISKTGAALSVPPGMTVNVNGDLQLTP
jgi:PKD repeat protein